MPDKNKLYVIGGKSRTGKSKIADQTKNLHGSIEIRATDSFRPNGNDDLAWINLMNDLRATQFSTDVLIEGVAITPERVHQLTLDHLILERAVFLGYGRESHADSILAYAQSDPTDWVARKLKADPSYENDVRSWMEPGIRESAELKKWANEYGYRYFDITDCPIFEEYLRTVTNYLLASRP